MSEDGESTDSSQGEAENEDEVVAESCKATKYPLLPEISLCRVDPRIYDDSVPDPEIQYFGDLQAPNQHQLELKTKVDKIMNHIRLRRGVAVGHEDYKRKPVPEGSPAVYLFSKKSVSYDKYLSCFKVQDCARNNYSTLILVPVLSAAGVVEAIYAISGGHAWRTLYCLSDQNFLTEIPLKLANPGGALCHKVSVVVGRCRAKESVFRKEVNLLDLNHGEVCTKFTATVDNALLIQEEVITRSQKLFNQSHASDRVKFVVTQGRIIFKLPLDINEVVSLCKSLEEIFTAANEKYQIPNTKVRRLVIRASRDEEGNLNDELSYKIACLMNNKFQPKELQNEHQIKWESFDVCHKFEIDFISAKSVNLEFDNQYTTMEPNPDIASVITQLLRMVFRKTTQGTPSVKTDVLKTATMSFLKQTRKISAPLLNYLRGHFYSRNYRRHYWMLNSQWYFVSEEFLSRVQNKFQEVLQEHLLPHLIPPSLPKKIKYKYATTTELIDEEDYNKEYLVEDGYYVGDKGPQKTIEYFDLAYNSREEENTTYLHHVKKGFNNTTRDACSQLENSLELFEINRTTNENGYISATKIMKLAAYAFGENEELCKRILGIGPENENRKLKYVLSLQTNPLLTEPVSADGVQRTFRSLQEKTRARSLHLEKNLRREVPADYISNYIETYKEFEKLLKERKIENVQDGLIKFEYLGPISNGNLLVKPKLFMLEGSLDLLEIFPKDTVDAWKLSVQKKVCKGMKLMLSPFISYFASLGAKLEVIRCSKFARKHINQDSFKICEVLVDSDRPGTPKPVKDDQAKPKRTRTPNSRKSSPIVPKANLTTQSKASTNDSFETSLCETTSGFSSLQLSPQPSTSKQTSAQPSTVSPDKKTTTNQLGEKSTPRNKPPVKSKTCTIKSSEEQTKIPATPPTPSENGQVENPNCEGVEASPGITGGLSFQNNSKNQNSTQDVSSQQEKVPDSRLHVLGTRRPKPETRVTEKFLGTQNK